MINAKTTSNITGNLTNAVLSLEHEPLVEAENAELIVRACPYLCDLFGDLYFCIKYQYRLLIANKPT
jgi:hypothetical protein